MVMQLLLYDQVEVVCHERHRGLSVKAGSNFDFARDVNSVPLMAIEFRNAAKEYPIVFFSGSENEVVPVVVMGIRDEENLYVDDEGKWQAKYVPAFVRQYPFVFSSFDDGLTLTLCIDEKFSGCNQDGLGEQLYDDEGNQTQYLTNVLEFLKQYQASFQQSVQFCKRLKELDILENMEATFTPPDGQAIVLTGFLAIDRNKFKALPDEKLAELVKSDEMELIYTHLVSLRNLGSMPQRHGADGAVENVDQEVRSEGGDASTAEADAKKPRKKKVKRSSKTRKRSSKTLS